jgi:folate-binding Fe-S cluster repair protein YgfZ
MSTLLFELPHRGRIKVLGEDRKRLLHAMTTNHIQQLEPGQGCYAFFLSAQGRIQSDVTILAQEDHLLLDLEPAQAKPIFAHLDKYIIADDVTLEDATDQQTTLALEGPGAKAILEKIGAPTPEARYASAAWAGRLVVNTTYTGAAESYHIYLSPLGRHHHQPDHRSRDQQNRSPSLRPPLNSHSFPTGPCYQTNPA